jgi:hypothetical protein
MIGRRRARRTQRILEAYEIIRGHRYEVRDHPFSKGDGTPFFSAAIASARVSTLAKG